MPAEPNLTERDYELLSAYLDGALTESERSELERRLPVETELRRELDALRQTVSLVNQLPPLKAPHSFALTPAMVESREKVIPMPRKKPRRRSTAFGPLAALAAAVVVIVFGGVVILALMGPAVGNVFSNVVHALNNGDQYTSQAEEVAAVPSATPMPFATGTPLPALTSVGATSSGATADNLQQSAESAAAQPTTESEVQTGAASGAVPAPSGGIGGANAEGPASTQPELAVQGTSGAPGAVPPQAPVGTPVPSSMNDATAGEDTNAPSIAYNNAVPTATPMITGGNMSDRTGSGGQAAVPAAPPTASPMLFAAESTEAPSTTESGYDGQTLAQVAPSATPAPSLERNAGTAPAEGTVASEAPSAQTPQPLDNSTILIIGGVFILILVLGAAVALRGRRS